VRVNARLVSAGGSVVWSRTFDRLLGETLALEAEVARDVASGVQATVTPEEHLRLTQVRATTPSAEQAYFKGLHQLHQLGADNLRAAIEAFRRAIELDPNYAEAHAALARAHITMGFMRITSQAEARVSALAAASRAAELDPASAAAHEVLADLKFFYDWDWPGAEASYRRAIDLSPSSDRAHSQYARFLIARGRSAAAREEAERAVALDPISAGARSAQALVLYYIRDYDRALDASAQALQLDPGSAGVYFVQSRIHAARGSLVDAVAANERAIAQAGRASTGWRAHLILLQALAGKRDEARAALRTLSEEVTAQNERIGPGQLAYIEAALGNRDGALDHLEAAAKERDSDLLYLAVDPRVDSLRGEPRFKRLIALLGSPTLDPPVRLP
jgi:tetratricopeptide (TPR) repeat protein